MTEKQLESRGYVRPEMMIINAEAEQFICVVSVGPDAGGSNTQTNWDDKGEHDAGTVIIGDGSSMAPAKQGGWFDEEDFY